MSYTEFNKMMRRGFVDPKEETCCCGPCVDGWTALDGMLSFVKKPELGLTHQLKTIEKRLDRIRSFVTGDYRWKHLAASSNIATHCLQHALASDADCYSCSCDDHLTQRDASGAALRDASGAVLLSPHVNTCVECNMWEALLSDISRWIKECLHKRELEARQETDEAVKATALVSVAEKRELYSAHIELLHQDGLRDFLLELGGEVAARG